MGTSLRAPNTLTILPYPGFPLAEGAKYAAILFNNLKAGDGSSLKRAALIDLLDTLLATPNLDAGMRSYVQELIAQRQAVFDYADAKTTGKRAGVVAFTVFTTQKRTISNAIAATLNGFENKPADSASKPFKHRVTGVTRAVRAA